jgi:hypothetical protein
VLVYFSDEYSDESDEETCDTKVLKESQTKDITTTHLEEEKINDESQKQHKICNTSTKNGFDSSHILPTFSSVHSSAYQPVGTVKPVVQNATGAEAVDEDTSRPQAIHHAAEHSLHNTAPDASLHNACDPSTMYGYGANMMPFLMTQQQMMAYSFAQLQTQAMFAFNSQQLSTGQAAPPQNIIASSSEECASDPPVILPTSTSSTLPFALPPMFPILPNYLSMFGMPFFPPQAMAGYSINNNLSNYLSMANSSEAKSAEMNKAE